MIIDKYADAMPASIKVLTEETKNRLWGYE